MIFISLRNGCSAFIITCPSYIITCPSYIISVSVDNCFIRIYVYIEEGQVHRMVMKTGLSIFIYLHRSILV